MTIYQYIQQAAKKKGISIRQLELALGFSNGSLRKWKDNVPTEKLTRVANYLNVDPVDLIFGPATISNETKAAEKTLQAIGKPLIEQLIQLDDLHKQRVFAYTQAQVEDQNRFNQQDTLAAHQADSSHIINDDEAKNISKFLDAAIDRHENRNK